MRFWNAATGQSVRVIPSNGSSVLALTVTAGIPRVVSGDEKGVVVVRDLATGQVKRGWKAHPSHVMSLAASPDGARLITGSLGDDHRVRIWDTATGTLLRTFQGHPDNLNDVAFSPDGSRIASVGEDRTIRVWDAMTGKPRFAVLAKDWFNVFSVAFSPEGQQLLVTGTSRGAVEIDADTGKVVRDYGGSDLALPTAIDYSLQGDRLAVGTVFGTIDLWDTATARLLLSIKAHRQSVDTVAFSPDGARLLSGGEDGTLSLWDLTSGKLLRSFGPPESGVPRLLFHRTAGSPFREAKPTRSDSGIRALAR